MDFKTFKAAVLKYKDSDKVNPVWPEREQCIYVGQNGEHCLIGQVAIDIGHCTVDELVLADSEGFNGGYVMAGDYVFDEADPDFDLYITANLLQTLADGSSLPSTVTTPGIPSNVDEDGNFIPRPWSEVIDIAVKRGIL